ncbi:unnamed protein product [Peronospora destructor]|uniref:Uncharacterized protein n=1 Tax=Peronospora destructor TaxID=86335 RepID=A0AAV0VG14_9STRA|nr:unnamed protein product [Peronospora destructor]
MTRLGLSDSMRSTASLEETASLGAATQCQGSHRRPEKTFSRQETKLKPTVFSNPLRVIVGSILAVILIFTGGKALAPSLRASSSSSSKVEEKLEQLERSLSLLYNDTARLKTTADRFLQHCQETHVAVSTRKKMLQSTATRRFDGQVKTQTEEHAQVTKEVLQYYAEQKQKIQETKERLIKMNISLPVEIAARSVHKVWQDEQKMRHDSGELLEKEDTRARGLSDTMKGLVFSAEKNQLQDKNGDQRFSLKSISIPTAEPLERSNPQTTMGPSTWHGSIFFYVCVVCASAVYLWNAIVDTRNKELLEDKWSWSPVPKTVIRLKRLLGSVVVIEDLQTPRNEDVSHKLPKYIEPIEC